MTTFSRREFLAGVSGTFGGAALLRASPAAAEVAQPEYLLDPGLNYLNTAALGPTPRSVLDATMKCWKQLESNPVMMAYNDGPVLLASDRAREELAGLLGCSPLELLITRGATSAMNILSLGMSFSRGDRILMTDVEHEGGSICWTYAKKRDGIEIDIVSIAQTDHDVDAILKRFEKAITPATKVISVSHVVSSTGLRMPIAEIARMARSRKILCVVDGAQAVGCIDVNVKALGCDAYAGTGHKWLMGPKGTGFLYINKDAREAIQPVELEAGNRFVSNSVGMGALPLVVGLGTAALAMKQRGMRAVESRVLHLRNRAYVGLKGIRGIQVVSPPPGPLATALLAFTLPNSVESGAFRALLLKKYNIVVKITEKRWGNGNRISPHIFNTESDIDAVVKAISQELSAN